MITIYIDDRENINFKNTLYEFYTNKVNNKKKDYIFTIKTQRLDIGDIHIQVDDNLYAVIERKTYSDMSASIKDMRSHEQLSRLKQLECRKYYLLETSKLNDFSLPIESILQSFINKDIEDDMRLIRTYTMYETCCFIDMMCKAINPNKVKRYKPTVRLKKCSNPLITMLTAIKGVSETIATAIYNKAQTMSNLIKQYEINKDYLIGIQISDKRKIGKKMNQTIYEHLFNC